MNLQQIVTTFVFLLPMWVIAQQQDIRALAFLPLFQSEMMILPLFFELCEFTPTF